MRDIAIKGLAAACRKYLYADGRFQPITPDEHAALDRICDDDPYWIPGPARRRRRWRGPFAINNLQSLSDCVTRAALTAPLDDAREMMRTVHEVWVSMLNAKWNEDPDTRAAWWAAYRSGMRDLFRALPENRAAFNVGRAQRAGKWRQRQKGYAEALALQKRVQALMANEGLSFTAACNKIDRNQDTGTTRKKLQRHGLLDS
jgi:hypothetical protein